MIDRRIFGIQHLHRRPVYERTKVSLVAPDLLHWSIHRFLFLHNLVVSSSCLQQCSINSPDSGPPPPDAPSWCRAPFDPEGLLRSAISLPHCQQVGRFILFTFSLGVLLQLKRSQCCSSVMATVTCLIGLQFGHVIIHFKVMDGLPFNLFLYEESLCVSMFNTLELNAGSQG